MDMLRDKRFASAMLAGAFLGACASTQTPDDPAVCAAYSAGRSGAEVVASGKVTQIYGVRPGRSSPHEGFLVRLDSGCRLVVRVEVNTDFTGAIPLQRNEQVVVKGEYEYYPRGGVVHWTHHDPRGRHENGYVVAAGRMYY
jgi:Protein of unknown function (DUF3465)